MTQSELLKQVHEEWSAARDCIARTLLGFPAVEASPEEAWEMAEVIIARLAMNDPPILVELSRNR